MEEDKRGRWPYLYIAFSLHFFLCNWCMVAGALWHLLEEARKPLDLSELLLLGGLLVLPPLYSVLFERCPLAFVLHLVAIRILICAFEILKFPF